MGPLKLVSAPHIKKDLKHTSIVVASHIFSMQLELVTYESLKEVVVEEMSKELQGLLNKYEGIFLEPKGLSPTRPQDHHIPLLPGSVSPNIRPYWYPYV